MAIASAVRTVTKLKEIIRSEEVIKAGSIMGSFREGNKYAMGPGIVQDLIKEQIV